MNDIIVEPYIFARKDQLEKARKAGHLVACFGKPEYSDMIALYSQSSIDALCKELAALQEENCQVLTEEQKNQYWRELFKEVEKAPPVLGLMEGLSSSMGEPIDWNVL